MIIDSHCHLNMKDFNADLPIIVNNAKKHNISGMLTICTNTEEANNVRSISHDYENIWYSLGIHPHNVNDSYYSINKIISKSNLDNKFIGIGETGLDYYYKNSDRNLQKDIFQKSYQSSKEI